MPSSSSADDDSRDRLARQTRIEQIVEHLRGTSVDPFGATDIAAAADLLVDIKIERALYMGSVPAVRRRHDPNMGPDPKLAEHDERCEASRLNLRRILQELGVRA